MRSLLGFAFLLMLASCDRPGAGRSGMAYMAVVDPLRWGPGTQGGSEEQAAVRYANRDTVSLYDLMLVVDYDRSGPADRFTIDITTLTPDSLTLTEAVEVWIDRSGSGNRRYDGFGNRRYGESRVPYRTAVRLRRVGKYRFSLAPDRELCGIRAVGLEFSKH